VSPGTSADDVPTVRLHVEVSYSDTNPEGSLPVNQLIRSRTAAVLVAAGALTLCATSGAVAGSMITTQNIKDHTIASQDMATGAVNSRVLQNGAVHRRGLAAGLLARINQGKGPKGDAHTTYVDDLHGLFTARDTDVAGLKMTGDGVQFGPFANGGGCDTAGTDYARLDFSGMNGKKLSTLKQLDYTGWYVADNDTSGVGAPTMRVYFEGTGTGGDGQANEPNRLTFSPNTQFNKSFNYDDSQGAVHTWLVTHGTVRYNDDGDVSPAGEKPWTYWVAQYPDAKISDINILNGCQAGTNLTSVIRSLQVNGHTYVLGG
jgi:hypothetical protein